MEITVITSGKDGKSQFVTRNIMPIKAIEGTRKLSHSLPCHAMLIHEFDTSFIREWYNPPEPQYVVILEGELQIQLRDSSSKNFKRGEMFLAEDLTGSGHRIVGIKPGKCLIIW